CAGCTFANAANPVRRVEVDKELILTHKEKVAFDKFKASIYKNVTTLNLKFVKHDLYLLRWIRAKNLDVARAQREFFEFLEFIRENNLDKIQQEDFSDILEDHPYNDTITDLRGRPLGYGSIGSSWNIRRTIVQGRRSRLIRLAYRMYIGLMEKVVELNGKQQNITRFSVLMNFDGFNLVQHACPNCVSTYIVLLQLYERYLPECAEEIIIINAPSTWYTLLGMLRPFFSPDLNRALKIFGPNTNVWKPYLDNRIDPDKLPEEYGGNRGESQER
ncbi:SEC14-like protein 2, partial [Orchesella cincta]